MPIKNRITPATEFRLTKVFSSTIGMADIGAAEALCYGLMIIAALSLFGYGISIDSFNRLRGDASHYFQLASSFSSLADALTYMGDRTLGFPLLLFLELKYYQWSNGPINAAAPQVFLNQVSTHLFLFHIIASLGFIWTIRKAIGSTSGSRSYLPLFALLIHPGMIFHTTVLLADTFSADLLMVAGAILLGARWRWMPLLAGMVLGFATLVRPSYQVPLVISMLIWLAWSGRSRLLRGSFVLPLLLIAGYTSVVLPEAIYGRARYGRFTLQNPDFVASSVSNSWNLGRESPRIYWSRFAPAPEYLAVVKDPYLTRNWSPVCPSLNEGSFNSMIGTLSKCFALNPFQGLAFIFKKAVALFDHYQIQAYATDLSPRWLRFISRPFGMLAFAGWIACFALLVSRLRLRMTETDPLVFLSLVTVVYGLFHCIPHVEPRYCFGALPGALFGLGWAIERIRSREISRATKLSLAAMLVISALGFAAQTSLWDNLDPYQAKIEARNS